MRTNVEARKSVQKKFVISLVFVGAVVLITTIGLRLGEEIANPTTMGFSFLILVSLAALFAGRVVGIGISVISTLCFNYFFFPPIGTFTIADRHNWIALFAFLFTAVLISRLTDSALENARKAKNLELTVERFQEFSQWLLSSPVGQFTLSDIAKSALKIFHLEYCSIHVYAEGKWHHFSGASVGNLDGQIAERLKATGDHPTDILELAQEEELGVRYAQIRAGGDVIGLLVVRDDKLTPAAANAIASIIGLVLVEIVKETAK